MYQQGKSPRGEHGHVVVARITYEGEVQLMFDVFPSGGFLDESVPYGWAGFFIPIGHPKLELPPYLCGADAVFLCPSFPLLLMCIICVQHICKLSLWFYIYFHLQVESTSDNLETKMLEKVR